MSHRARCVLLLVVGALVVLTGVPMGASAAVASVPGPPDTVVTPITDNQFIPDRDLDDCVSALPQPGCGSENRSGWRQWAVFGVLVVALSFIGWRIVRTIRKARHDT